PRAVRIKDRNVPLSLVAFFASSSSGVGHPAIFAITCSEVTALRPPPILAFIARCASGDLLSSFATGVGHPEKPLPDVRRADARSAQIGGPDGISHCFQVSSYSGEPFTSSF